MNVVALLTCLGFVPFHLSNACWDIPLTLKIHEMDGKVSVIAMFGVEVKNHSIH